jgi:hypothetical protein
MTNPALAIGDGDLAENSLGLTIDRYIEEGVHEDFSVANYSGKKMKIGLFLAILWIHDTPFSQKNYFYANKARFNCHCMSCVLVEVTGKLFKPCNGLKSLPAAS